MVTVQKERNLFVNNYCDDFKNLRLDEDFQRNSVGRPFGFQSDEALSRQMTYVLRHGAYTDGIKLHPGGFVNVNTLLEHRRFRGKCNENDFRRIVAQDPKGRYHIRNDPHTGALQIRANQGHTIKVIDDGTLFQRITQEHGITESTHGTSMRAWMSIRREGLSRMKRNHIHMVPGGHLDLSNPHLSDRRVILIVIDVHRALFDEIEFFRSTTGVLLSPGDKRGFIAPKYFKRVTNAKTGEDLLAVQGHESTACGMEPCKRSENEGRHEEGSSHLCRGSRRTRNAGI
ncbi:hypothetical protein BIW11_01806 [Tropilaelaps mercedesae]|uniref:2'-phosphotransferase n=1 Tax=Tropilaelaps mercedesae TaxID=418985 RepID=A0A1V9X8G4_9ACAR|nr:hypothetical protein BIW11_01806 [Tropilaelaps mercedesae]